MDRFENLAEKVDWIDRKNGATDLLKLTRIGLQTKAMDRSEEQVGLLYTIIEKLNVWSSLCPNSPQRDMMALCRCMGYERHDAPPEDENEKDQSSASVHRRRGRTPSQLHPGTSHNSLKCILETLE